MRQREADPGGVVTEVRDLKDNPHPVHEVHLLSLQNEQRGPG